MEDDDLLEAFKKDFQGSDLLNSVLNESMMDEDVQIIQTWYNQNKKIKVTEVSIQCNLPYTRTNREIDELYESKQNNLINEEFPYVDDMSECESDSSVYEDFIDFETDSILNSNNEESMDILSYVVDKLQHDSSDPQELTTKETIEDDDLDLLQQILDLPTNTEDQVDDTCAAEILNNNDFLCLSNETTPEKMLLPNPIENMDTIPQFDGADDNEDKKPEDNSPRKDFTIAGLLSPPMPTLQQQQAVSTQQQQQQMAPNLLTPPMPTLPQQQAVSSQQQRPQQQRQPSSDDDVIFVTSASRAPSIMPTVQHQPQTSQHMFVTPSRSQSVIPNVQSSHINLQRVHQPPQAPPHHQPSTPGAAPPIFVQVRM